jgi:CubicO group peptidase (beta-lactamase class C family)
MAHSKLGRSLFAIGLLASGCGSDNGETGGGSTGPDAYPVTGQPVVGMTTFEEGFIQTLSSASIPGAAVAIASEGGIVYLRGFGYGQTGGGAVVQPDSLFRIASVSKSFTAVAALKLLQDQAASPAPTVTLDAPLFDATNGLLAGLLPAASFEPNISPAVPNMTTRQMLNMTAGWSTGEDGVLFGQRTVAAAGKLDQPPPATEDTTVSYVLGWENVPNHPPGSCYEYSDIAYLVLGRVIEAATGGTYEDYVKINVLEPMGITTMASGDSHLSSRMTGEVMFYGNANQPAGPSLYPDVNGDVEAPYGADFALEYHDSNGGWVAEVEDLVTFVSALDNQGALKSPLDSDSTNLMFSCPSEINPCSPPDTGAADPATTNCFGMGFGLTLQDGEVVQWSKNGDFAGTFALLYYLPKRKIAWAAVFNQQPLEVGPAQQRVHALISSALDAHPAWGSE